MDTYFTTRLNYDKKRTAMWKVLAKFIQRYISKSSIVLDLGAGYCDFINSIKAKEKHALDVFTDMDKYAHSDVITHIMPASKLSKFKDETFDVVFASNFFEHLEISESEKAVEQVFRILKTNGKLIVLQPNFKYGYKEYFDDYTHKTIFTHISFANFLEGKGFKITKIFKRLLPFTIKNRLPKLNFLLWIYLRLPIRPFACQMLIVAKKQKNKNMTVS